MFQELLSERTDQYALAVSYYQLRTGRLPFPEGPDRFERHYRRPWPDLSALAPCEQEVIGRALAPAPQDRWESCYEMMDELARVVA